MGCGGKEEAAVLKFTAIPDQNTTELAERFQPLSDYLAEALGVKVEYVPARDYQASVEMFRNGDIHLAWFGGLTGVQARAAVPGARGHRPGRGRSASTTPTSSPTRRPGLERGDEFPAGIADLTFTFGSESSTSGRLMPEYYIRELGGAAPAEFFSQPFGFSGSHDKTVELVEAGRFQAGVVNYKVYDKRVAAGTTDPAVVPDHLADSRSTPTTTSPPTPSSRPCSAPASPKKLQDALVGITDTELLAALPREALIPATSAEFEGIAVVARGLGMVRCGDRAARGFRRIRDVRRGRPSRRRRRRSTAST